MASSRARWTSRSFSASSALVASSSSRIGASRTRARAMASRWRSPPESVLARSPSRVSKPSGSADEEALGLGGPGGGEDLRLDRPPRGRSRGSRPPSRKTAARPGPPGRCDARTSSGSASRRDRRRRCAPSPPVGIVEAQQQAKDRALAGPGRADQGHALARSHVQARTRSAPADLDGPDRRSATSSKAISPRGGLGNGDGSAGRGDGGPRSSRSPIRSMAPAAFCTSPQASPSAPTAPAAKTARMTNCSSAPALICRR